MVVAVQICRENTDIDEVLRAFDRFRFVVIYTDLPCRNVHLGGLNSLCWRLRKVLAKLFPRRCEELNLPNRWDVLDPLLRDLADPEEIVALANGFLEVQLGGLREEGWVNALKRQVIVRQMLARKPDEFVQLLAYACRRPKEDRLRLCGESAPERQVSREGALAQELAEKDLLLDNSLRGWAAWLAEEPVTAGLFRRKGSLPGEHQRLSRWESALEEAAGWMEERTLDLQADWADPDLEAIWMLVVEGQLQQAQEELEALEWRLEVEDTTDLWRTDYFFCVGELHRRLKNLDLANRAFEQALLFGEGAPLGWRVSTLTQFAAALTDQGRFSEAETQLCIATELDTPAPRKAAAGLALARLLLRAGQESKAESLFIELSNNNEIKIQTGAIYFSIVAAYAGFLFQRRRFAEAERWFRLLVREAEQNARLFEDPAWPIFQLATCLRNMREWNQAIAVYERFLSSDRPLSTENRVLGLTGLGACRVELDETEQAEAHFQQAVDAAGDGVSPTARASLHFEYGKIFFLGKSWQRTKEILQPAVEEVERGEVPDPLKSAIQYAYGQTLKKMGRFAEAAPHLVEAAQTTSGPFAGPRERRKVLESLAEVYDKLGRHAEKKKLLREAATLPGGPATDTPMLLDLNLSRPSPASALRL